MSESQSSERLESVDALRGIAAVAVVLFHFTTRYDQLFIHREPLGFSVPWGHLGVNLFFMISGFVIFMTLDKTRRPADFVVSRFSRLFPAYWCAVILTYLIVSVAGLPGKSVTGIQLALNFLMVHSLFGVPHVDGVYWTLEVELLFYLLMLSLWTAGVLRWPRTVLTVWLIASSARAWLPAAGLDVPYVVSRFLILQYIPYFLVGMAVYLMFKRGSGRDLRDWALVVAAIAVVWMTESVARALWAATFAGLVFIAVFVRPRVLTLTPIVWLGAISYPLYLIHENAGWALILILEQKRLPGLLIFLIAAGAALALAGVLHYTVEVPAMRRIREWYRKQREQAPARLTFDRRRWLTGLCGVFFLLLLGNRLAVAHMRNAPKSVASVPSITVATGSPQECTAQGSKTIVILVLGQSNAANHGETIERTSDSKVFFDGRCYRLTTPVPGATGSGGAPWPHLARLLEDRGHGDLVFAVHAIDATTVAQWADDGWVSSRLETVLRQLQQSGLTPSLILWQQGEADARKGTSAESYIESFGAVVRRIRETGVAAPMFVARATECRGNQFGVIWRAQSRLPTLLPGVYLGPDLDPIRQRYDGCHFDKDGLPQVAEKWASVLLPFLGERSPR